MPATLEVETEQDNSTDAKLEEFQQLISGGNADADEPAETEEQAIETDEAQEPEAPEQPAKVEGPSREMLAIGRQAGVPDALLKTAVSNEQIDQWIEIITGNAREAEPEPEPQFEFKSELPEVDYPEDDPVRKEFASFGQQVNTLVGSLKEEIASLSKELRGLKDDGDRRIEAESRNESRLFDQALDALNSPALGNSVSSDPDDIFDIRAAVFKRASKLLGKQPNASIQDLAVQAAKELNFISNSKTPEQKQAILNQASKKLGGGPSPTAPSAKLDPIEAFQQFIDGKINMDGTPKS